MVRLITATEAKNRFGQILKSAYLRDEHLIVQRSGIPVVAIVPMQDYEQLIATVDLPAEVAQLIEPSTKAAGARARLRAFLDEAQQQIPDVPEEEVDEDILTAVKDVRSQP